MRREERGRERVGSPIACCNPWQWQLLGRRVFLRETLSPSCVRPIGTCFPCHRVTGAPGGHFNYEDGPNERCSLSLFSFASHSSTQNDAHPFSRSTSGQHLYTESFANLESSNGFSCSIEWRQIHLIYNAILDIDSVDSTWTISCICQR